MLLSSVVTLNIDIIYVILWLLSLRGSNLETYCHELEPCTSKGKRKFIYKQGSKLN